MLPVLPECAYRKLLSSNLPVSPEELFNGLLLLVYFVDLHAVEIRRVGAESSPFPFPEFTVSFHQILRLQGLVRLFV